MNQNAEWDSGAWAETGESASPGDSAGSGVSVFLGNGQSSQSEPILDYFSGEII